MPLWLIEWLGGSQLDSAFAWLLFMTAPFWLAMLALPENRLVHLLASPFIAPVLYLPVLGWIVYQAWQSGFLPAFSDTLDYRATKQLTRHPVAFLALFCQFQILNLTVGTLIYQNARKIRKHATVEITLAWVFGPIALLPFSLRLAWYRRGFPG